MKANELRLGNYVYDGKKELGKIGAVHKDRLTVEIPNDNTIFLGRYKIEYAKPIPLTEEFLLKFGFDKVADDCWMISKSGQATYIDLIQGEFYYYLEVNTETSIIVKHVHQLQNLYFALTGQELTIKE